MSEAGGPVDVRCVVFDVDDTLYLERDYVRSGFEAVEAWVQEEHGVDGFASVAWRLFLQGARGDTFDRAFTALDLTPAPPLVRRAVEIYRAHPPDIALLEDARACLDSLHGRVDLAVITDGPASSQRAKIDALGLWRWHPQILVTDELGPGCGKPHPRAFERVEEESGWSGSHCLYVGDNPAKDFVAPIERGWRTLRVRRTGGLHASVPGDPAVTPEVIDLSDLRSRLEDAAAMHRS